MQRLTFPLLESVISDLRRDSISVVIHGFELLADETFLGDLRTTLDDPSWRPFYPFLRRHITGFAAFRFHWTFLTQPASPWVFLNESKPIPPPANLLRYTLRRAALVRYKRLGVPFHVFNRRVRMARALAFTDKLLKRHIPK